MEDKTVTFKVAGEPACFTECICRNCHRELCGNACKLCVAEGHPSPCIKCPDFVEEDV